MGEPSINYSDGTEEHSGPRAPFLVWFGLVGGLLLVETYMPHEFMYVVPFTTAQRVLLTQVNATRPDEQRLSCAVHKHHHGCQLRGTQKPRGSDQG
jgi:hypothetical protein